MVGEQDLFQLIGEAAKVDFVALVGGRDADFHLAGIHRHRLGNEHVESKIDDLPGAEQIATLDVTLAAIAIDHHDRGALVAQGIERLNRAVEDRLRPRGAP